MARIGSANEAIKQSVQASMGLGIISRHSIEMEVELEMGALADVECNPFSHRASLAYRASYKQARYNSSAGISKFLLTEAERLATAGVRKPIK